MWYHITIIININMIPILYRTLDLLLKWLDSFFTFCLKRILQIIDVIGWCMETLKMSIQVMNLVENPSVLLGKTLKRNFWWKRKRRVQLGSKKSKETWKAKVENCLFSFRTIDGILVFSCSVFHFCIHDDNIGISVCPSIAIVFTSTVIQVVWLENF